MTRTKRPRRHARDITVATMTLLGIIAGRGAAQQPAGANALTREQVVARLSAANEAHPANFAGQKLSGLDLSGVDFSRANLAAANLDGSKFVHGKFFSANLDSATGRGADFTGATFDVSAMRNADFSRAIFRDASLYAVIMPRANFTEADLTGARLIASANDVVFARAKLAHADMGADPRNQPMGVMRSDFTNADFTGADFTGANLRKAQLVRANLTGATLTDADLSLADVAEAVFHNIRGRETIKGLSQAKHVDEAHFDH